MRRRTAIIAAIVVAAAVAVGCGLDANEPPDPQATVGAAVAERGADETPDPQAVVGAACAAIAERGAVDISVEGESSLYGESAFPWIIEAEFDGEDYRLLRTFVESPDIETIRAGEYIYSRLALEGGEWSDWSLTEAAIADRDQFPYPLPLSPIDPAAETCEHADASAFQYVGEETIAGTRTQRFAVDFAAQFIGDAAGDLEGELRDNRDFWIDSAGRIMRVRTDYFAQGLPYFFDEETVTVATYSGFGEPNAIAAPPNVTPSPTPTPPRTPTPLPAAP